ncbi:hypothetical protein [Reichenbachiella versicolor]|uniref:hypothetical protein n=1 Tax=Reichenbachiella versicolor TaxID=1821036 RepID=UPI000D6E35AA|nr:hypothetical protein [Reichenbachiella versicolor]
MELLNPNSVLFSSSKYQELRNSVDEIYRRMTFCNSSHSERVLSQFVIQYNELKQVLAYQNAIFESPGSPTTLHFRLQSCIHFITSEIKHSHLLESEMQLI